MRMEPNALLAVTTGCSLGLLIASATMFGEPGLLLKYVLTAIVVTATFPLLNAFMRRRMGLPNRPIITLESTNSAMWATLYPAMVTLLALIPMFWTGRDFGLLIIIASVWFGGTLGSAIMARREPH